MPLAETAQLLVKLTLQDDASGTANKVKTSLGDMGKVALGVAGAAGFGALTKGALEAEAAQGKFMAATGASRDEAKAFVSDMNDLAGTAGAVGLSFEDIADAGTAVSQQFQIQGDEARDLTSDILEYAKVTHTDGVTATNALEDALSAYGLGAEDAAGFTDQLVKSSQDFGTDAGPAAVDALKNMAPALTAMNEGLDYGIGALNLFEDAGVDATTGQQAFNKAVDDIPPGGSFDDIIAKLGAIEDPALKDAEAVRIFGERAGHKMALAIKPGMDSLDDYKVSIDDAAGATSKAADDMLTFGDRIRGWADKAMAGARELGQDFGPAVTGIASLGSLAAPFAGGIKDMLAKAAATILPAAFGQGVAMGEATAAGSQSAGVLTKFSGAGNVLGKALGLGIAAGVGLVLVDQLIQVTQDAKTQIENDPQGINNTDLFNARAPMWAKAKVQAATEMQAIGKAALDAFNKTWTDGIAQGMSPSDPALLQAARAAGEAAGEAGGDATVNSWGDAMTSSGSWGDAVESGATTFKRVWESRGIPLFKTAAGQAAEAFSQKVLSERGTAQDAWKSFVDMMKHPLDTAAEIAELKGDLASKKMVKGLNSNDPQVKQWAENTRDAIQNRINDLEQLLGQDGTDAGQALADHLQNQAGAAGAAAAAIMRRIEAALHDVRVNVDVHQDPGHVPGGGRAEGGPVKKGIAYIVGEKRPELFIPEANGTIIPRLPPMSVPHPYAGPGVAQIPPISLRNQITISSREVATQVSHYQVLQGSRLPVSRV